MPRRHRSPREFRAAERAETPPTTNLDKRTKLLVVVLLLVPGVIYFGWQWLRHHRQVQVNEDRVRVHEASFRAAYHLNDDQLRQIRALETEHAARYRPLHLRAEASRRRLKEQPARPPDDLNPEQRQRFEQAQAEREACWTEEIEHHRRMSQVLKPEDGQRYLAKQEARYRARKFARDGLLLLPHRGTP